MRILFTFAGGRGHLEPLLPLARAARAAGHVVAFAGRPRMVPQVEEIGFPALAAGSDAGLTPVRRPLARVDVEGEIRAVGSGFGWRIARERAADLLPSCGAWQPDLLVCEELDFGAMVVAERLSLPHATLLVSVTGSFVRPDVVADPLNRVRAEHGLPPDPDLAMPGRYLVLSPFPPGLRDPAAPPPANLHEIRPLTAAPPADAAAAPWSRGAGGRRVVYLTLGTVFNVESGDLFGRALAGLRDLPIEVVVTLGREIDPAELGARGSHVHVRRYAPQATLLPHCHAVVAHGGSGSVLGALAHGLPMVLLPLGADQPLNAARCASLGAAQVLDAVEATPGAIRDAVRRVLEDPGHRWAAERMRDEIAALPEPAEVVPLLERLVRGEGRPGGPLLAFRDSKAARGAVVMERDETRSDTPGREATSSEGRPVSLRREAYGPVGDPSRHLPLADLEAGLRGLPAPARDRGRVALVVRRHPDGTRESLERVVLSVAEGVPGDGWSRRPPRDPEGQLAAMRRDVAELLANGQPLSVFGDNLFVDLDLSAANLPPGTRLRVGEAEVVVTAKPHDGCRKFHGRFGADALRLVQARSTRHLNLRGVYWKVVEPGAVRVGDAITVLARD